MTNGVRLVELVGGPACGLKQAVSRAEGSFKVFTKPRLEANPEQQIRPMLHLYIDSGKFSREGLDLFIHDGVRE